MSDDSPSHEPRHNQDQLNQDRPKRARPSSPVSDLLGIQDGISDSGTGSVSMLIGPEHLQDAGIVHGGVIAALADTAFFQAVRSLLKLGERTTTIELKINFLAPASKGKLTATAKVISSENRLVVAEMQVTDPGHALIAQGLGTYMVLPRRRR